MTVDFRDSPWNSYDTAAPGGMATALVTIEGHGGDKIHAYVAVPEGAGRRPGVVLVHHAPGFDELYLEFTRRFAQHGYNAICPDLYCREGHGKPDDVAAKVRADGGVPDDRVVGDLGACVQWLAAQTTHSGKVGMIGSCSAGRHTVIAASKLTGLAAAVDLWGGLVVMAPDQLTPKRPVAPIDMTKDLKVPLLGIFGNDDKNPSPQQVDQHEAELKKHGRTYEFHRYDGAGHGFFYYDRPAYRAEEAVDAWGKVFAFFSKHLA